MSTRKERTASYGRGMEARSRPCKRRKAICARMWAAQSARRIDAVNTAESTGNRGRIVGLQERRLGRTILRTYRAKVDLDDVLPNERQPRVGPKEDDEL